MIAKHVKKRQISYSLALRAQKRARRRARAKMFETLKIV